MKTMDSNSCFCSPQVHIGMEYSIVHIMHITVETGKDNFVLRKTFQFAYFWHIILHCLLTKMGRQHFFTKLFSAFLRRLTGPGIHTVSFMGKWEIKLVLKYACNVELGLPDVLAYHISIVCIKKGRAVHSFLSLEKLNFISSCSHVYCWFLQHLVIQDMAIRSWMC